MCSYCVANVLLKECCRVLTIHERNKYLRERRNELLKETDYYVLPDFVIDENKLNAIKLYRQELRDWCKSKLLNDEIERNLIDDDFEKKYFPKLILDGTA